jgi:hypothetical protein
MSGLISKILTKLTPVPNRNLNYADFHIVPPFHLKKWLFGQPMIVAWGAAILFGMFTVDQYQMTPGANAAAPPARWPAGVTFPHNTTRSTLVMMLHPRCPCSRASLHELAELLARSTGRLDAHIIFVEPANAPADWLDGDLWQQAKTIPNVTISVDKDGRDAAAFDASTSGQIMVYDAAGIIRFSGGITDGRGHEGDNAGLQSILDLVRTGTSPVATTPVYGCSLGVCRIKHN